MTDPTSKPMSIAIAFFDRVTMLGVMGPDAALAGLPNSQMTLLAEATATQ